MLLTLLATLKDLLAGKVVQAVRLEEAAIRLTVALCRLDSLLNKVESGLTVPDQTACA